MKLTFGEYLIQKSVVSEADLSEAWLEQLRSTPTIAEIVLSRKLLPVAQWLQVVAFQTTSHIEFASACKQVGLWTPEIEKVVFEEIRRARKSYLSSLLGRGTLKSETVNQYFDSYLLESATADQPEKTSQQQPSEAVLVFIEQFNEVARDLLLSCVEDSGADPLFKKAAVETAHRLYGAAQFANLARMKELFRILENKLGGSTTPDAVEKKVLFDGVQAGWLLREHLKQSGGESGFESKHAEQESHLTKAQSLSVAGGQAA